MRVWDNNICSCQNHICPCEKHADQSDDTSRRQYTAVQRISRTTETMGYRTIITGQSYLSGIQWAPLALVGLAVIVLLILVAMALRRKTYQLPSFHRGEENASNHSPVQTRVEFDYITGKSQTSIHTPTQSKLPEIQIPSAEKKNSFCCVDAKLKYASTFYQEHYLNRHCHSCLRLIDDHSPRCSTIVTVNCSPCVHVNIDKYPFK
ncbi:uncharacterized protein [Ptychodera flava]|uniref:uncharacterized protein n=1 Tax=Ptychodera flava TaxID=63121 RepID=UPI00396A35D8